MWPLSVMVGIVQSQPPWLLCVAFVRRSSSFVCGGYMVQGE